MNTALNLADLWANYPWKQDPICARQSGVRGKPPA